MRLDKYLSDCLADTRSQCRQHIRNGRVCVNQEVIRDCAFQISESDVVTMDEKPLMINKNLYFMFHKPSGCVCATRDAHKKTVLDYFPRELQKKLLIVGRLDLDTEGLLFLTDDGAFAHRLTSPKKHIPKTYYFESSSALCEKAVLLVKEGLDIGDEKPTLPAKLVLTDNLNQSDRCVRKETEKCEKEAQDKISIRGYLTITEGRYHQVKRMIKVLGGEVTYLKRISVGDVILDETLPPGEFRPLTEQELASLY